MHTKHPILLISLLLSIISLVLAASSTSFCKCTCFNNSTIIQLDGAPASAAPTSAAPPPSPATVKHDAAAASADGVGGDSARMGHGTCLDCNKRFCMDYNLPICKGAKEEDVFTTCFQRDSAKDEAVVFIFIFATVGLLVYAAVKPWLERWLHNVRERRTYAPVSNAATEES